MDVDAVVAEVAAAVGLAEGPSGVRDVLSVIGRAEPAAVREVSRITELPVPLVAAVCNELRARGIVDHLRPLQLTPAGRQALGNGRPHLSAACPQCRGLGLMIPAELAGLAADLEQAAEGGPQAKPELDQTHCTVATKIHRVLRMHEAGALAGRRILLLGDDDLIAVAIARFAARAALGDPIRRLTVVDSDPDVLSWTARQMAGGPVTAELVEHDLRRPLPADLAGCFNVACTDPPYTVAGAELFLSRAVAALVPEPGQHVFFSFGARRPAETLRTQEIIAALGLAIRSLSPGFNAYQGAGILAGASHLYHLRSTAGARPLIEGEQAGPLYTADQRAAAGRPYRCAQCKAVHPVGPGRRWLTVADLQSAGCPACGGTVFRPMPRQPRGAGPAGQGPARPGADPMTGAGPAGQGPAR